MVSLQSSSHYVDVSFLLDKTHDLHKKERPHRRSLIILITRAAPRNGLTDVTSTVNSAQAPSRHTGDST